MKNILRTTMVLALMHLAGIAILYGQAITGGILGSVTDPTGRLLPGAQVTITNEGTGISFKRTTDRSGNYSVD